MSKSASLMEMIAVDDRSQELAALAKRVAASNATVMISGETGTGKEVLARYIHENSARSSGPFIAINCAAIPENMLEATLFGYEKGAFTGAYHARPGKFEQAQGGTLLLDEISEMDLGLQAKLLRVLQENEVERLGGKDLIPLDLRVLATTNRCLKDEVAQKNFREDLYYRLNVFPLQLAPLRDRPRDILPLVEGMIQRYVRDGVVPEISSAANHALLSHSWPGNVRELENVVQRALILKQENHIDLSHISIEDAPVAETSVTTIACTDSQAQVTLGKVLDSDLKSRERELIVRALEAGNGSRKEAAARLGISPRTLRYKVARLREAGMEIPQTVGMSCA